MSHRAKHKFARISATKVRPFADLVRGEKAEDAINILRYYPNRGARMLEKVLKSAIANAENARESNIPTLVVLEATVDEGPKFRRMRPRARGMAHIIEKKFSHINVTVGHE